jgi:hypothetical protein
MYTMINRIPQYTISARKLLDPSEKLCIVITSDAWNNPRAHKNSGPVTGIGSITPGCVKNTISRRVQPSYIVC